MCQVDTLDTVDSDTECLCYVTAEEGPHLQILPAGPQTVRASRNLVLTCRAQVLYCTVLYCTYMYCTVLCCTILYQVPNTELVRDLRWLDPRGEEVTQDTRSAAAEYRVYSDQCNHVTVSACHCQTDVLCLISI